MSASFKKGHSVAYRTPKGSTGTGKISEIKDTAKGAWYVVKKPDGGTVTLRAAGLTAA